MTKSLTYDVKGRQRFLQLLVRFHGLKPYDVAPLLGITVPTFYNWLSGRSVMPVYAPRAVVAAMYKMKPSTVSQTIDNYKNLGVSWGVMDYWRRANSAPHLARLATTYIRTQNNV